MKKIKLVRCYRVVTGCFKTHIFLNFILKHLFNYKPDKHSNNNGLFTYKNKHFLRNKKSIIFRYHYSYFNIFIIKLRFLASYTIEHNVHNHYRFKGNNVTQTLQCYLPLLSLLLFFCK